MEIGKYFKKKVENLKKSIKDSVAFQMQLKKEEEEAFRKVRLENLEELERAKEKERRKVHLQKYKNKLKDDLKPKTSGFGQSEFGLPSSEFSIPGAYDSLIKEEVIRR